MSLVKYQACTNIGVITVDNPPVNAVSIGVPRGVIAHLDAANADPSIEALVLHGCGRGFIAGADIREFGKPHPVGEPTLSDMINALEASGKPVVAAIHGNALGGGLETAMGCQYRVAAPDTNLGQPEVKLGLPPGAGGTQRLPRLVGMRKALDMIVGGAPIKACDGAKHGLIDELIEGDLVEGAIVFAKRMLSEHSAHPSVCSRPVIVEDENMFDEYRKSIAKRARGRRAPYDCIDCLEVAARLPFGEGLNRESEIFQTAMASVESQAMRHVFFAEREAAKIQGLSKDVKPRDIKSAAVMGAGTMGGGIAMNFANAGIPVVLLDQTQEFLDRGMTTIEKNYAATVSKGRLSETAMQHCLALIKPTLDVLDIADADIVVEAVFEEMPIKKQVFKRFDEVCKADAILASNTSYLDVNELAAVTSRAGQVLGTHFFSPANVMRLLEVVRADSVSEQTLASVMGLAKKMRKVAVVSGVCNGFIGNRMLEGYFRESAFLIEEGALPQDVDRVMVDFGMAMGPFAVSDLAGLDIGWRKRKAEASGRSNQQRYSVIADRLCEQGRYGQKTMAGYYRYEEGSRAALPDASVEALIFTASSEAGIERRQISDQEILERCLYPLINEGAKILEEGIAQRASDIDTVYVSGYGFPDYKGGPMFYADTVGLDKVHAAICQYQSVHGETWRPAALLKRLASVGGRFQDQ
jgi:3-hydroxyacyl-CoA dehydrogenase